MVLRQENSRLSCVARTGECLRQICKRKGRFVVFLHADLRSDGLIAAACCYWVTGGASECRMAW